MLSEKIMEKEFDKLVKQQIKVLEQKLTQIDNLRAEIKRKLNLLKRYIRKK
jgi:hypothetical protein